MPTPSNELNPITGLTEKSVPKTVDLTEKFSGPTAPISLPTYGEIRKDADVQNPDDFDFAIYPGMDYEEIRAQNQGGLELIGKGVYNTLAAVPGKTGAGFGHLGGFFGWALTGFDPESIDLMTNNSVVKAFNNLEEGMKTDIYRTGVADGGSLWEKLHDGTWWATTAQDGVSFALSALAPGAIVSKIRPIAGMLGGGKLAQGGGIARAAVNAEGRIMPAALKLAYDHGDDMIATVAGTLQESGVEAQGSQQNIIRELTALRQEALDNGIDNEYARLTDQEINFRAGQYAAETFAKNSIALLGPNLLTQKLLFSKTGLFVDKSNALEAAAKTVRENAALVAATASGDAAAIKAAEKTLASLSKQYGTAFWKNSLKSAGISMLSEGAWEENIQLAIEHGSLEEALDLRNEQTAASTFNIFENFPDLINNFGTDEGQESIFLGALLGGVMGGVGGKFEQDKKNKLYEKGKTFFARMSEGMNANFGGKFSYDQDTGNFLDADGKAVKNIYDFLSAAVANSNALTIQELMMVNSATGNHKGVKDAFENYMTSHMMGAASSSEGKAAMQTFLEDELMLNNLAKNILPNVFGKSEVSVEEAKEYMTELYTGFNKSYDNVTRLINPMTINNLNVRKLNGEVYDPKEFDEALREVVYYYANEDFRIQRAKKDIETIEKDIKHLDKDGVLASLEKELAALENPTALQKLDRLAGSESEYYNDLINKKKKQRDAAVNSMDPVARRNYKVLKKELAEANKKVAAAEAKLNADKRLYDNPFTEVIERGKEVIQKNLDKSIEIINRVQDNNETPSAEDMAILYQTHSWTKAYLPKPLKDFKAFLAEVDKKGDLPFRLAAERIRVKKNVSAIDTKTEDAGVETNMRRLLESKLEAKAIIEEKQNAEKALAEEQAKKDAELKAQEAAKNAGKPAAPPVPPAGGKSTTSSTAPPPESGGASPFDDDGGLLDKSSKKPTLSAEDTEALKEIADGGFAGVLSKKLIDAKRDKKEEDNFYEIFVTDKEFTAKEVTADSGLKLSPETAAKLVELVYSKPAKTLKEFYNNVQASALELLGGKPAPPTNVKETASTVAEDDGSLNIGKPPVEADEHEAEAQAKEDDKDYGLPNTVNAPDPVLAYTRMFKHLADNYGIVVTPENRKDPKIVEAVKKYGITFDKKGYYFDTLIFAVKHDIGKETGRGTLQEASEFWLEYVYGNKESLAKKYPKGYAIVENARLFQDYVSSPSTKAQDLEFELVPETLPHILDEHPKAMRLLTKNKDGKEVWGYLREPETEDSILNILREDVANGIKHTLRVEQKLGGHVLINSVKNRAGRIKTMEAHPGGKFRIVKTRTETTDNLPLPSNVTGSVEKGHLIYVIRDASGEAAIPVRMVKVGEIPGLEKVLTSLLFFSGKRAADTLEKDDTADTLFNGNRKNGVPESTIALFKEILKARGVVDADFTKPGRGLYLISKFINPKRFQINKDAGTVTFGNVTLDNAFSKEGETEEQRKERQTKIYTAIKEELYVNAYKQDFYEGSAVPALLEKHGLMYTDVPSVKTESGEVQAFRQPVVKLNLVKGTAAQGAPTKASEEKAEAVEKPPASENKSSAKKKFSGLANPYKGETEYEQMPNSEIVKTRAMLPQEQLWFSEKLLEVRGKLAFGVTTDAGITLFRNALKGTAFHESFHIVSQFYLSDAERKEMYDEVRKVINFRLTDAEAEEWLADDFQGWMYSRASYFKGPKIVKWFLRLWDMFYNLMDPHWKFQELYRRIERGDFANAKRLDATLTQNNIINHYAALAKEANIFSHRELKEFNSYMLVVLGSDVGIEFGLPEGLSEEQKAEAIEQLQNRTTNYGAAAFSKDHLTRLIKTTIEFQSEDNTEPFWKTKAPAAPEVLAEQFISFLEREFNTKLDSDPDESPESINPVEDKSAYESRHFDRAAALFRFQLATVPNYEKDKNGFIYVKNEEGSLVPKPIVGKATGSFQATPTGVLWNELVTTMGPVVVPEGEDYYDTYRDVLGEMAETSPRIMRFKMWLDAAVARDPYIKNKFVVTVRNQKLDFVSQQIGEDEGGNFKLNTVTSESAGMVRTMTSRWASTFQGLFFSMQDAESEEKKEGDKTPLMTLTLNSTHLRQLYIDAFVGTTKKPSIYNKYRTILNKASAENLIAAGTTLLTYGDKAVEETVGILNRMGIDINTSALTRYVLRKSRATTPKDIQKHKALEIVDLIENLFKPTSKDFTTVGTLVETPTKEMAAKFIKNDKLIRNPINDQKTIMDELAKYMIPYADEIISPMVLGDGGTKKFAHSLPSMASEEFNKIKNDFEYFKALLMMPGYNYLPVLRSLIYSMESESMNFGFGKAFTGAITEEVFETNREEFYRNWLINRGTFKRSILNTMYTSEDGHTGHPNLGKTDGAIFRILSAIEPISKSSDRQAPLLISKNDADKNTQLATRSGIWKGFKFIGYKDGEAVFDHTSIGELTHRTFFPKEEELKAILSSVGTDPKALLLFNNSFQGEASRLYMTYLMGVIDMYQKTQAAMDYYRSAVKNKKISREEIREMEANFAEGFHYVSKTNSVGYREPVRNEDGSIDFTTGAWWHMGLFEELKPFLIKYGYAQEETKNSKGQHTVIRFNTDMGDGRAIFQMNRKKDDGTIVAIQDDLDMLKQIAARLIMPDSKKQASYMRSRKLVMGKKSIFPKSVLDLVNEIPEGTIYDVMDRYVAPIMVVMQASEILQNNALFHGYGNSYGIKKGVIAKNGEKRDGATEATVVKPSIPKGHRHTNTRVAAIEDAAMTPEDLKKHLVDNKVFTQAQADAAFGDINIWDAISYITEDYWKSMMEMWGMWSNEHDAAWDRRDPETGAFANEADKKFMLREQSTYTSSMKGVLYGYSTVEIGGQKFRILNYHKESQFVLSKAMMNGSTGLAQLGKWMNDNRVDKATNGMKAGGLIPTRLFEHTTLEDGRVVKDYANFNPKAVANIRTIPTSAFGKQQETPNKDSEKVNVPTQLVQNLKMNMDMDAEFQIPGEKKKITGRELMERWAALDLKWLEMGYEKFVKEWGDVKSPQFYAALKRQFIQKGTSQDIIDALDEEVAPTLFISEAKRIYSIVYAAYLKAVVRQFQEGMAAYQVPNSGLRKLGKSQDLTDDVRNGIVYLKEESELKPEMLEEYEVEEDGKKVTKRRMKPAGVLVPMRRFRKLFDHHNFNPEVHTGQEIREFLKKNIPAKDWQDMMTIIGARIPNQDMASNDYLEIVGLLPDSVGDVVIGYTELPGIKGSDFDIDKMYMMMYNTIVDPSTGVLHVNTAEMAAWVKYQKQTERLAKKMQRDLKNYESNLEVELVEDTEEDDAFMGSGNENFIRELLDTEPEERRVDIKQALLKDEKDRLRYMLEKRAADFKEFKKHVEKGWAAVKESRDAVENERFKLWVAIISDANNYKALIDPIDSETRKEHAEELMSITGVSTETADRDQYSPWYQEELRVTQHEQKRLVGVVGQALPNTHMKQMFDMKIPGMRVGNEAGSIGQTFVQAYEHPKTKELIEGDLVSKHMGSSVNMTVDASKNPWGALINQNQLTFGVSMLMMQAGIDMYTADTFLYQPILRMYREMTDIYERQAKLTDYYDEEHLASGRSAMFYHIGKALKLDFPTRTKEQYARKVQKYLTDENSKFDKTSIVGDRLKLTNSQMKKMLNDNIYDMETDTYPEMDEKALKAQIQIFLMFEDLLEPNKINMAIAKVKPATDGSGKSREEHILKTMRVKGLLQIEEAGKLEGFKRSTEEGSMSHFMKFAYDDVNKYLEGLSFADTPKGLATIEYGMQAIFGTSMEKIATMGDETAMERLKKLMDHFNSYSYSHLIRGAEKSFNAAVEVRETTLQKERLSHNDYMNKLLFSENAKGGMATRYLEFKRIGIREEGLSPRELGIKEFTESLLFKTLSVDMVPNQPFFVKLDNLKLPIGMDINDLKAEWADFVSREDTEDISYTDVKDWLHDLVIYSYFASGFNYNMNTLHTLIPMDIIRRGHHGDVGINAFNMEAAEPFIFDSLQDSTPDLRFIDQFKRHHAFDSNVTRKVSARGLRIAAKLPEGTKLTEVAEVSLMNDNYYAKSDGFFVYIKELKKNLYYRYVRDSADGTQKIFQQSHPMGYYERGYRLVEYMAGESDYYTMFKHNHPPATWDKTGYESGIVEQQVYTFATTEEDVFDGGVEEKAEAVPDVPVKAAKVNKELSWGELSNLPVYSTKGVMVMRKQGTHEHFGNPFTGSGVKGLIQFNTVAEAVQAYKDWLSDIPVTELSVKVQQARNTPVLNKQRQWILEQITSGRLDGETLLYMKDKGEYYSHADALADIVNSQTQPTPTAIEFYEDPSSGYQERTRKNASADATIAIAIDFETAGEKLTKRMVTEQGKKYIPIDGKSLSLSEERVAGIVKALNAVGAKTLNIAGNGIYTMQQQHTQDQLDSFVYNLLKKVLDHPELENKIVSIRTGGQTGIDEAGAKAGQKLGIRTIVLAPKGWKFRTADKQDRTNEAEFKARFSNTSTAPTTTSKESPSVDPDTKLLKYPELHTSEVLKAEFDYGDKLLKLGDDKRQTKDGKTVFDRFGGLLEPPTKFDKSVYGITGAVGNVADAMVKLIGEHFNSSVKLSIDDIVNDSIVKEKNEELGKQHNTAVKESLTAEQLKQMAVALQNVFAHLQNDTHRIKKIYPAFVVTDLEQMVSGELDALIEYEDGRVVIFDMKTGQLDTAKWGKQLSAYRIALRKKGIFVEGFAIAHLPFDRNNGPSPNYGGSFIGFKVKEAALLHSGLPFDGRDALTVEPTVTLTYPNKQVTYEIGFSPKIEKYLRAEGLTDESPVHVDNELKCNFS